MRQPKSLLTTVGSIGVATLASRLLGFVRMMVHSYFFGASQASDAFLVAFRIPNLFRDLFAEGALSAAFVPTFVAARRRGGDAAAWRLTNRLAVMLVAVLGGLTVVIALGAPWIIDLYAPGFAGQRRELAIVMTRILSPFLLFVALAAVAMGSLNARGRFFLPALAPASLNVCTILFVIALVPWLTATGTDPILALAFGTLAGGAMQLLVQLPALSREGFRLRPEVRPGDPGLRRIVRLMLPATLGLAATQINLFVDTSLASRFDGAVSWLTFGFRLMQLPLGIFGVAIGTVNLARVSEDVAREDPVAARRSLGGSLRACALLTLPATAGLIALREPIVSLVYERGRFDGFDTMQTAGTTLCYALGLFAYAATKSQAPTFYALGDTRTPVIASTTSIAVKIVANFALLWWLPRIGIDGFFGLALSTSLAAWLNFTMLGWALRRRLGSMADQRVFGASCRMAVLSAGMGYAVHLAHGSLARWLPSALPGRAAALGGAILLGVAIVALGARLAGLHELDALWRRGRRPA